MYICGCIWYNTWCWTYSVNWELMRMIFYLIRILAACKNPKNHWANKFCFNFCLFLLYLKLLSWNLHFYSVFLLLTKFLYERRWWSIFSKVPDRKPLFLLNIKIKQNPGCQISSIMQYLNTFVRISGPIPNKTKSRLTMIGKMLHIGTGTNLSKAR